MAKRSTLTAKQRQAALLLAQGLSLTAVAKKVRSDRNTIARWRKLEAFADLERTEADALVTRTRRRFLGIADDTIDFLEGVRDDPEAPLPQRISAAIRLADLTAKMALAPPRSDDDGRAVDIEFHIESYDPEKHGAGE